MLKSWVACAVCLQQINSVQVSVRTNHHHTEQTLEWNPFISFTSDEAAQVQASDQDTTSEPPCHLELQYATTTIVSF